MKIKFNYIEHEFIINKEQVMSIEIENKKYFYRVVYDFYKLYNGYLPNELYCYDEQNHEINLNNKIKIFINFFDFSFDSKKYANDISKYINSHISEQDKTSLLKQYTKILKIYNDILNDIDVSLSINTDMDIDSITKIMKIQPKLHPNLLDNLFTLIDLEKILETNNLLIFINLKQYLNKDEIVEFYKYSIYNEVKVLFIDSQLYKDKIKYEKKLIIDSELDEFMIQ